MSSLPKVTQSKLFYLAGISLIYALLVTFFSLSSGYLHSQEKVLAGLYQHKKSSLQAGGGKTDTRSVYSQLNDQARGIASLPNQNIEEKPDLTELSEFYFSRYRELIAAGNSKQALKTLNKIQKSSTQLEVQMKSSYFKAIHFCKASQEKKCLKEVDYMVTQSPDSEWTGRALVLLTGHYLKVNRLQEVLLLKDVVKLQFKDSAVVMRELNRLKL